MVRRQNMTKVEMNECKFMYVNEERVYKKPLLVTCGISTCIAIVAQGAFEGIPYLGLYHWAGFNGIESLEHQLTEIFSILSTELLAKFGCPGDVRPPLNGLYIIGGEKAQSAADGALMISGTEAEVAALEENFMVLCQQYFDVEGEIDTVFHNFLTQDEESLTVNVYPDKVEYVKETSFLDEKSKRQRTNTIMFGDNVLSLSNSAQNKDGLSI